MIGKATVYYRPDTKTLGNRKILKLVEYAFGLDRFHYSIDKDGTFSACVTDGVTRDLPNGNILCMENIKNNNVINMIKLLLVYFYRIRKLAFACKKGTKIFCNSNLPIKYRLKAMNGHMQRVNDGLKCDCLGNNYYACTMAGVVIEGDFVSRINIGDANVMFVKEDGSLYQDILPDSYSFSEPLRGQHMDQDPKFDGITRAWENNDCRALYRKTFINTSIDGASYGNLDGREGVYNHFYTSSHRLGEMLTAGVNFIFVYTDGSEEIINTDTKRLAILNGEYPEMVGSERTLMVIPLKDESKRLSLNKIKCQL